ncbi:MAG: aspartate aminotransferase family protein, partial [Rubrivivax sp.]|nr:aspartate aminotransferase family protein [Rubrivivax sp.]
NARVVGDYFQARLREMLAFPVVGDARGMGLIGCVELVKNKATKEMFPAEMGVANKFGAHLRARGLLCRPLGNILAFSPPLCITTEEVDLLMERLRSGLEAGQKALGIG